MFSCFSVICWKDSSPLNCLWNLVKDQLTVSTCIFFRVLFCSTNLGVFSPTPAVLIPALLYQLRNVSLPTLFLSFSILFAIRGLSLLHINFWHQSANIHNITGFFFYWDCNEQAIWVKSGRTDILTLFSLPVQQLSLYLVTSSLTSFIRFYHFPHRSYMYLLDLYLFNSTIIFNFKFVHCSFTRKQMTFLC